MWTAVYKKEINSYLHSPVIYVMGGIFFFLVAYFTLGMMIEYADVYNDYSMRRMYGMEEMNVTEWVVRGFFSLLHFLMLFLIPLISMRLIAEEKKSRTFEVLVTCPLRDGEIVAGKFLAALSLVVVILALCGVYPLLVERFSQPEWPVILTGYLGLFLLVLAYLSFGMFASSVTENQIIAAFLSFAGLLFFYLVGDVTTSREGFLGRTASAVSLRLHGEGFTKGVIELRDVFYFLAFSVTFLYLSMISLKARYWKA